MIAYNIGAFIDRRLARNGFFISVYKRCGKVIMSVNKVDKEGEVWLCVSAGKSKRY